MNSSLSRRGGKSTVTEPSMRFALAGIWSARLLWHSHSHSGFKLLSAPPVVAVFLPQGRRRPFVTRFPLEA